MRFKLWYVSPDFPDFLCCLDSEEMIPTDTLDETEDGGGISEPSSALLQACGPREPHPRQVDILLDKGMPVTCKIQW